MNLNTRFTYRGVFGLSALFALFALTALPGCDRQTVDDSPPVVEPDDEYASDHQNEPTNDGRTEAESDHSSSNTTEGIERSMLWEVDGPGGPVWLMATIHVGVDFGDWEDIPPELRNAIEHAELAVFEIDLDQGLDNQAMGAMFYQDGQTLTDFLNDEQWHQLVELSEFPETQLEFVRPWVVMVNLAMDSQLDDDTRSAPGVDRSLRGYVEQRDIDIDTLETASEQALLLDELLGVPELVEMLQELEDGGTPSIDGTDANLPEMIATYRTGDAEALREMTISEEWQQEHPEMYEGFIVERNHNWLPAIETYLERGNVLVAVGAGHVLGEDGLLKLLEDRGYDIRRLGTENGDHEN